MRTKAQLFGFQVLYLGLLWGALEALLGGLLHQILPPTWTGRIMVALTAAILMLGSRVTHQPWTPLAMAREAAPLKFWSAAIYGLPMLHPPILNPAIAILTQGVAMALGLNLLRRVRMRPLECGAAAGALAGALHLALFVLLVRAVGVALYPMGPSAGGIYPHWALTSSGITQFLGAMLLPVVVANGIGAALASCMGTRPSLFGRPAYLLAGSMVCLLIWLGALQL